MKFTFKIQQYQTDAVDSIAKVFEGQPHFVPAKYRRDVGNIEPDKNYFPEWQEDQAEGFKNENIALSDSQLLDNIRKVQTQNNIKLSSELVKDKGRVSLDVEMETGTGKTYVYTKTMFELNKQYGWSKFIIVVPSIAIREGVAKSFDYTAEHFMEQYHKKARAFIYNSKNLNELDNFSSSDDINVMIINTQAFARSFEEVKEGKKGNAQQLIIYSKRDEFQSRRPIDVIAANNPILILDEPQKMGGEVTQKSLKSFKPLFSMNFSATHAKQHNLVYALDAVDAFNQKLVKKIQVKTVEVKNSLGTKAYAYLDSIILSQKEPPKARIEIEVEQNNGLSRKTKILSEGDNLYFESNNREPYKKGYEIAEINPGNAFETGYVVFSGGEKIHTGELTGDISDDDIRRAQIRETIKSHFEKEEELFYKGIKTLSLFFIDEVSKYRKYDDDGNQLLGDYGKIFEEEYKQQYYEKIQILDNETPYIQYLKSIPVEKTHDGYFSIDKKGFFVNNVDDNGKEKVLKEGASSEDVSAYDLIIKRKELLLSFDHPVRFIFSHSALREGWDNPNVFQICTLKKSNSITTKRQEVGRGMRLCVDKNGIRQDATELGMDLVQKTNLLTVIANENYSQFVSKLQEETKADLYERPTAATVDFFIGKTLETSAGQKFTVDDKTANKIHNYLIRNNYIDDDDKVTQNFKTAVANGVFAPPSPEMNGYLSSVVKLVQSVYDDSVITKMFSNGNTTPVKNKINRKNFDSKEFKELWKRINHKYAYKVSIDSESLISDSVRSINSNLTVSKLSYQVTTGDQKEKLTAEEVKSGTSFGNEKTATQVLKLKNVSSIAYDLLGQVGSRTRLTRNTCAHILSKIQYDKFLMYHSNPEEFIRKVSDLINEEKAKTVIDHLTYTKISGEFDTNIFTQESNVDFHRAFEGTKCILDYVITDGTAEESVEKKFAKALDGSEEVAVYAKLPKSFFIPTPVGNYSPDWAIAFNEGKDIKHIYFVAETKGSMSGNDLREVEKAKINCADKLFNTISQDGVMYRKVSSYSDLMNMVKE